MTCALTVHFAFFTDSIFVTRMSAVERAVIIGRLAATMSPAALYSLQLIYNAAKPGTSTALQLSTAQIARSLAKAVQ